MPRAVKDSGYVTFRRLVVGERAVHEAHSAARNVSIHYILLLEVEMTCDCGCGETPIRGSFSPGHDQRLRVSLEKRAGGLAALRMLVESAERLARNEITPAEHTATVLGIVFNNGGG